MNVFRFRSESEADICQLRLLLPRPRVHRLDYVRLPVHRPGTSIPIELPDCIAEIETEMSLDELRGLMRQVEDGHVMVQTVQPKDRYTGERNFAL